MFGKDNICDFSAYHFICRWHIFNKTQGIMSFTENQPFRKALQSYQFIFIIFSRNAGEARGNYIH